MRRALITLLFLVLLFCAFQVMTASQTNWIADVFVLLLVLGAGVQIVRDRM